MSTGILAPERTAQRRVEVRRELDLRLQPWTALGVLVSEYGARRVIAVCSREALAARLAVAIDASTVGEERENLAATRANVLSHTEAVPVLVVGLGEVALELATEAGVVVLAELS